MNMKTNGILSVLVAAACVGCAEPVDDESVGATQDEVRSSTLAVKCSARMEREVALDLGDDVTLAIATELEPAQLDVAITDVELGERGRTALGYYVDLELRRHGAGYITVHPEGGGAPFRFGNSPALLHRIDDTLSRELLEADAVTVGKRFSIKLSYAKTGAIPDQPPRARVKLLLGCSSPSS